LNKITKTKDQTKDQTKANGKSRRNRTRELHHGQNRHKHKYRGPHQDTIQRNDFTRAGNRRVAEANKLLREEAEHLPMSIGGNGKIL